MSCMLLESWQCCFVLMNAATSEESRMWQHELLMSSLDLAFFNVIVKV